MMPIRRCPALYLCLLVVLGACASPPPEPPAPGVVAEIDSLRLHADDLRRFAQGAPAEGDTPAAQRQSYLRGLIASHLLEREARSRGLDTTSAVRWRVDSRRRRQILQRYRNEVVWSQVAVSETMAQAYFDSLGLGRQRQVWGILVETRADARNVLSLLRLGRSFEEVARQRSVHRPSAEKGGLLGYVSLPQARALGIPDSIYADLEAGDVSPVLGQGSRFQVIRFTDERTTDLSEFRAGIVDHLVQRLEAQRSAEQAETLVRQLDWRLVPGTLDMMQAHAAVDGTLRRYQLEPGMANEPLFTYTGGFVTLGEYLDALWEDKRAETGWGMGDSAAVAGAGRELLLPDRLFLAHAIQLGIDQDLDDDREERLRQAMLIELRRQVLEERVGRLTPAEARHYYESHPELFRKSDDIIIIEALVETEAEAEAILAEVAAGADFAALAAERTQREEGVWDAPGTLRLGDYERRALAPLYQAASTVEIGVVSGPVKTHDGWSVFQVAARQPGALRPFEEVERRATGLLRTQRQNQAFDAFVEELMDAYDERVQIYPTALEAALPDSLLQPAVPAAANG